MSTSSSSQPTRPFGTSSSSSSPANDQAQPRNSGSTTRAPGTSAAPGPTSLRWDQQTIQFSVNAWVFVVAVLAIMPLVPRNLSNKAHRLSFMGTACSSLYSLYSLYGVGFLYPVSLPWEHIAYDLLFKGRPPVNL